MTAITTRSTRESSVRDDSAAAAVSGSLLRFALRADATVCAGFGLLITMAADPLSQLAGLSAISTWIAGAALVGYGAALYLAAGVPGIRRVGLGVFGGNVAFAVAVGIVLVAGWLPLTEFGVAAIASFAVITLALACAQYLGVRRLT